MDRSKFAKTGTARVASELLCPKAISLATKLPVRPKPPKLLTFWLGQSPERTY